MPENLVVTGGKIVGKIPSLIVTKNTLFSTTTFSLILRGFEGSVNGDIDGCLNDSRILEEKRK